MVTASIPYPVAARSASAFRARTPLRERVSATGAAVLSILGLIGLGALLTAGLLVVPLAAAIVFGPALLAAL